MKITTKKSIFLIFLGIVCYFIGFFINIKEIRLISASLTVGLFFSGILSLIFKDDLTEKQKENIYKEVKQ